MINVLIADKQTLTCEGTMSVLSGLKDVNVHKVDTRPELNNMLNKIKPEVLIMDHQYSDVFNIGDIKSIYENFGFVHILILTNTQPKNEILEVINLGVKNYVNKGCSSHEIIKAVYATAKGEKFFCENTLQTLFGNNIPFRKDAGLPSLSARETEIVHMIADGLTNKEIADKLFLSFHTVKTHRKNIIKKLGFSFKNAAELILLTANLI